MKNFLKLGGGWFQRILNQNLHGIRSRIRRLALKNRQFTLVANNCVAGTVYKDLGLEYRTPFVGLFIMPDDFVRLCAYFEYYMGIEPIEKHCPEFPFPVGQIEEITIYFMHYKSFEEALDKWNARRKRIDFLQLGFILVYRDGCTEKHLQFFDSLNHANKVILTSSDEHEFISSTLLELFRGEKEVGNILEFKNAYSGERVMWDFNFVDWINGFR